MNASIKLSSFDCMKLPDVNEKVVPPDVVEMTLLLVAFPRAVPVNDPEEFVAAAVVVAVC